ncbi:MBL fold metallo-hydrolase [Schumannella luteola]|uniref:L-ascorbate metabolism protein UlaG (Beta-lactamase superfamily) n=1 Tax=Schumannella luteola TaxID=472059 RepID=A0A852YAJ5_9MICO|nr:MBL fold metallo-hydrolase [Schumannella luteola]NYG98872.1 L-ascorbate metabolism protein UlaG (beta-lactamase superfamily) [Schumannella luteola]TPX01953.1 MBL fold metallo-hydrolase [Schumannella luteola]
MKLTKYEHACLVLEKSDEKLVIDPGSFTTPLFDLTKVAGIVITHEHADHWTQQQVERVLELNEGIPVYSTAAVAAAATGFDVTVAVPGETVEVGPFTLKFEGGRHAIIHSSIPQIDNVAVLVDGTLFHPGDSFTIPEEPVEVLAVPSSAPWLKAAEFMDYVLAVKPKRTFPIHEMINSQAGKAMAETRIADMVAQVGGEGFVLQPGESIEL